MHGPPLRLAARLRNIVLAVAGTSVVAATGCATAVDPDETDANPDARADAAADTRPPEDVPPWPPADACAPETTTMACVDRYVVRVYPCGIPGVAEGAMLTASDCARLCPAPTLEDGSGCFVSNASDVTPGAVRLSCGFCGGGRRPAGFSTRASHSAHDTESPGALFAQMAALEAASVPAFRALSRELTRHRAPRSLSLACLDAAREERAHARSMHRLRARFGAPLVRARVPRAHSPRSLEALAHENSREGCVREAYGALLAAWQAAHARDPFVRRAMTRIARDEARHAELSLRIDAWARAQLDAPARARLDAARSLAWSELAEELTRPVPTSWTTVGALPDAPARVRLLEAARAALAA